MKKDATSIGIIGGIPDDAIIKRLEKEWGEPIKKIEKKVKLFCLLAEDFLKRKL